jgi:epoxyqueuosine reductase QueG
MNSKTVKEYGFNAGASVVGIAASKDFGLAPEGFKPTDVLKGCLSVIILGVPIPQEAIMGSQIGFVDVRNATNEKINDVAKDLTKQIIRNGYNAKAIGGLGSKWVDNNGRKESFGHISLKHAAELAGLGIIGKNYLLTNPQYGNLLWFSAVLTDAELIPDEKIQYSICNDCNKCIEICPSKALDNPDLFGKKNCEGIMFKKVNNKWEIMCNLCRKVCPNRFGTTSNITTDNSKTMNNKKENTIITIKN